MRRRLGWRMFRFGRRGLIIRKEGFLICFWRGEKLVSEKDW